MTKKYSIAEAKSRLPALVHEAEQGPPIELTRRGKPVAVLVSVREFERMSADRTDLWEALENFRRKADLEALGAEDVFANVRDPAPGRGIEW